MFNPFLVIRGLSCPRSVQISLTVPGFSDNLLFFFVVTLAIKNLLRSSIDLDIRPQSAFTAIKALLPSANYSAE
jgi:hypothetical protein